MQRKQSPPSFCLISEVLARLGKILRTSDHASVQERVARQFARAAGCGEGSLCVQYSPSIVDGNTRTQGMVSVQRRLYLSTTHESQSLAYAPSTIESRITQRRLFSPDVISYAASLVLRRFPPHRPCFPVSPRIILIEETDDLAFDASETDVKGALEALVNVGTVDVTRENGEGSGLYVWYVTFTDPALPAYSSSVYPSDGEGGGDVVPFMTLSFPLLFPGGEEDEGGGGLGLGTLAGGSLNVTRERRGTLGPLSGAVR